MTPERVENLFTQSNGKFHFARWTRPLAPVVFGTDDTTLDTIKDAIRMVASLGDLSLQDVDFEVGANFIILFCNDWQELTEVPNLGGLLPDLSGLISRLQQADANRYCNLSLGEDGGIKTCVTLLRYDTALQEMSAQSLAAHIALRAMLLWSDTAFRDETVLGVFPDNGLSIVAPEFAALMRAAYDPVLPAHSQDPVFALRLSARATQLLNQPEQP